MDITTLQRLTAHIRDADQRQDALVELLMVNPATEDEANAIIRRVRYNTENIRRKSPNQIFVDDIISAETVTDDRVGLLHDAADGLNDDDRDLYDRLCQGHSQAEIADELGITRQAVNKRHRRLIHSLTKES